VTGKSKTPPQTAWNEFQKVELCVGTIVNVSDFPQAKKPSYILKIDFGRALGIKKSSAQITHLYTKEDLVGKKIIAVTNFPAKQIGPIMSECLVTAFTEKTAPLFCPYRMGMCPMAPVWRDRRLRLIFTGDHRKKFRTRHLD
jgi:tRNA-binding protein